MIPDSHGGASANFGPPASIWLPLSLSAVPFLLFRRSWSLLERTRTPSSAFLSLPPARLALELVRPTHPGAPQTSILEADRTAFLIFAHRLLHRAADRCFHRFSIDFSMLFRSTSQWMFDRSVDRFFVRSKTCDFEKSLRNIAHAHKNRCSTIIGRSTYDDAFPRKSDRTFLKKRCKNRAQTERNKSDETIENPSENVRKNEGESMEKRFHE